MAKQRYSLVETMADASSNIEEAKNSQVVETPIAVIPSVPESASIAEESNTTVVIEEEIPVVEEEKKEEAKPSVAPASNKKPKKTKKEPIIETDSSEKKNIRNVMLSDETLWRLDMVKNQKNRSRTNNDPFITQMSLIDTAVVMYLDQNYPETKQAYEIINNLSK